MVMMTRQRCSYYLPTLGTGTNGGVGERQHRPMSESIPTATAAAASLLVCSVSELLAFTELGT